MHMHEIRIQLDDVWRRMLLKISTEMHVSRPDGAI